MMLNIDQTCQTMSMTAIMAVFRSALLAVAPLADSVGMPWQDGKAYDNWDLIEESLYRSFVGNSVDFICGEGKVRPLCRYSSGSFDPAKESMLFEQTLGKAFRFVDLRQGSEPFDMAVFFAADLEREQTGVVEKPFAECRFAALIRAVKSDDVLVSNVGCVGTGA